MRCRDIDRLVTGYIEGELDERRSSAVRGHLRVCPACAARVEDEVRLSQMAADLGPVDPPPALWDAIGARLAEAEIADSRRSRLWLWVQRGIDAVRRWAVPLSVVSTAAIALLILRWPGHDHAPPAPSQQPAAASAGAHTGAARADRTAAAPTDPCAATASRDEEVLCQMSRSDRRYLDSIAQLAQLVSEERSAWTPAEAARFDRRLADLDRAALVERKRLAARAGLGPADRDPLYAIYQAKIEFMTRAVVVGSIGDAR